MAKGGSAKRHRRVKRRRGREEQMKRMRRSYVRHEPSLRVFRLPPERIEEKIRGKAEAIGKEYRVGKEKALMIASERLLGAGFWDNYKRWAAEQKAAGREPKMVDYIKVWKGRFVHLYPSLRRK